MFLNACQATWFSSACFLECVAQLLFYPVLSVFFSFSVIGFGSVSQPFCVSSPSKYLCVCHFIGSLPLKVFTTSTKIVRESRKSLNVEMSITLGTNTTCSMLLYLAFKSVLPHPFTVSFCVWIVSVFEGCLFNDETSVSVELICISVLQVNQTFWWYSPYCKRK